jgi:hypothetical protein
MKFRRTSPHLEALEALEALAAVLWFAELPPRQLDLAARHTDWVDVAAGTRLQQQGFHAHWLWIPANGALALCRGAQTVDEVPIGGAWGETEVLLWVPSAVDVVAPQSLTVLALPASVFHGMLGDAAFATGVARRQALRLTSSSASSSRTRRPISSRTGRTASTALPAGSSSSQSS